MRVKIIRIVTLEVYNCQYLGKIKMSQSMPGPFLAEISFIIHYK